MKKPERIAIVGPESTGKSELALGLAKKLNGCFVAEMARKYIDELKRPYQEEDLLLIAKQQVEEEKKVSSLQPCPYLICDTNLLVIKIWSLHKYHRCDPWIEEELNRSHYDLWLLTNIDLPWVDDPQREHPALREYLFNWYHRELIEMNVNYEIVTGREDLRLQNTLKLIEGFDFKSSE